MVAATGRLSSTDPNLQNIPIRTAEGREIRQAFVVGEGYECLLTADYSQIEMRIMAHLSEDAGPDRGVHLAARTCTPPSRRGSSSSRSSRSTPSCAAGSRRCRYGLAYGLSAFGLAQQLGITPTRRGRRWTPTSTRFGGVRDYLRGVVDVARRDGYTETILGRRRYLPDLTSDNGQRRQMAERMALNAPIQGSAADIIKVAMLRRRRGAARAAACARGCCCRSTTSWCSRWRRGSATTVEELVRRRDGRRLPDGGAARRLRRLGPHLGRRRPLTRAG